ncbi:MAG TPA: beta-ketoacyl-[acyl-carrier-protein] synthase family protein [Candidatus Limnocylindria bacterium]|nr:beta-ketoacyl-[acyl-carrier-protein] synthase family protein [Candidatus Limnocylindria bacterium]
MSRRRVVVTGIGAVTPVGTGRAALWRGVMSGRSAIRRIDRFDPEPFPSRVAAQIDDFVAADHLDARRARRLDRFSQLAVAAARLAAEDARLPAPNGDAGRVGVFIGSALGGVAFAEEQHSGYLAGGARAVVPTLATAVFGGAAAANVALDLGVVGPAIGNANSCASGAVAVGQAFSAIRAGELDVALAGGAEAPLAPLTFGAFAMIGVLSRRNDDPPRASRPFDRARDGFVMGEASAVLVLEEATRAARRGAAPIAEVAGYAASNDAFHMTAPRPDGREAARAISLALDDARLPAEAIGYVNAHGSSTRLNELAEAAAFHAALGEHGGRVPVSGTKGVYGHPLGASGAIEAAITAIALAEGVLPGTCNLEELDPGCDLNVLRRPAEAQPDAALSTSFGFGGMNAALVLRRAS